MAPAPVRHPLRHTDVEAARRRAIAAHPAGRARASTRRRSTVPPPADQPPSRSRHGDEDGSMTTEYGLIVVVGATACSLVIKWATGGAIFELLGGVLDAARGLVGF